MDPSQAAVGSSPRERGTHRGTVEARLVHRFIPARAGNARRWPKSRGRSPVHPRASGERPDRHRSHRQPAGSSPRERGTRRRHQAHARGDRFIPARAGNARAGNDPLGRMTVHPRASGERLVRRVNGVLAGGSSPRERGTPAAGGRGGADRRFIPARAGNARERTEGAAHGPVHPRASGERWSASWM